MGAQVEQESVMRRGFRVVWSYVRMHPLPFAVAVSSAAIYAGATVASAYVLGRVTDLVLVPAFHGGVSGSAIALGAGAVMMVALVRSFGIVFRRFFAGLTAARVQASLRIMVVDHYRRLPMAFHRSKPAGELIAHTESDVTTATDVLHPLPYSSAVVLLVIFAVVSLILTDPFLAAIGLAILPLLTILNHFYSAAVEAPQMRAQEKVGEVSSVAHESIDGALVVKTLGREAAEVMRLAAKADGLRNERIKVGRLRAGFEPAFDSLPTLGAIILLAVGSWRISTHAISTGTLIQFLSLFQLLAFPIRLLGFVLSDVPLAVVGRARIEEVLSEPGRRRPDVGSTRLPEGPLRLQVKDLGFGFDGNAVLRGVDFTLQPHETIALVGSTGAGKSTLMDLLIGLEDPREGQVLLGGLELRSIDPEERRRAISIVFQESFLFATTVRDNIALDMDAGESEIREAARLAQAHVFIQNLPHGYDSVLGERGVTLSGGQRQRIALARALLRRPQVLILDDATSAVDPTVEATILRGLNQSLRCTLLVVAYRVSTISLADRILFMEGGRIAAEGTHEQLLANPAYEAMVMAYERAAV
jgi:ABC-type multidrug transport system fused ATPase/permease subunit